LSKYQPATPISFFKYQVSVSPIFEAGNMSPSYQASVSPGFKPVITTPGYQASVSPPFKPVNMSPNMYRGANDRSPINEQTREEEHETRGNAKQPSAYSRFFADEPENTEDGIEYTVATAVEETSDSSSRRWGFW